MLAMFNGKPLFGPRGPAGPDGTPIGTIISYLGTKAPDDYLICDGTIYNISDYSKLAEFFKNQFGAENYFGGDGLTTFAVPDMRNLFLRGFHGSSAEQLSGDVGVKQEGTQFPNFLIGKDGTINSFNRGNNRVSINNMDSVVTTSTKNFWTANGGTASLESSELITARPVNMAVLYCIKANEEELYEDIYSMEETRIGKWIDGKPLYRRVIQFKNPGPVGWTTVFSGVENWEYWTAYPITLVDSSGSYPYVSVLIDCINLRYLSPNIDIYVDNQYYENQECILVCLYTKTTDVASL